VASIEKLGNEFAADVTSSAGDENLRHSPERYLTPFVYEEHNRADWRRQGHRGNAACVIQSLP
jgi:hypothetical protein